MDFITTEQWDEATWDKAKSIYQDAFADHGGKPEKIIRNMFKNQLCSLHVAMKGCDVTAMALTGSIKDSRILLIDYLAVRKIYRGYGIGRKLVKYIEKWGLLKAEYDSILLEAECENTPKNLDRILFWEKCGFNLIDDYVHHYIWVPEPYMAMVRELHDEIRILESGKTLFKYIEKFHKKSFRLK
ncbi:GNAT family N-acetyltransferase [Neobacillus sp. K501]